MSIIKTLLLEFQSKNYLYHFTRLKDLGKIMSSDKLIGNDSWSVRTLSYLYADKKVWKHADTQEGISFTRNRSLPEHGGRYMGTGSSNPIGLVFDRNKLKSNYKLHAFDVHARAKDTADLDVPERLLDEEIIFGDVKNLGRYIEFIYIPTEWIKEAQELKTYDRNIYIEGIIEHRRNSVPSRIPFKYFKNGNFVELEFPDEELSNSKQMYFIYKQLFE